MNTEKRLYQWDTGQKLVGCTGLYVDFPIGTEVYRVETTDGMCIIPDELLQTSGGHKVYECMTNNTIRSFAFSVTPRPKPPDYVYTPTERLTFEGLVQKVDDAVADMIRRAESGEFDGYTPVKGKDYFTASEIQQIQNEVSSGAIGEFKSVVDTETETFNNNAETKLTAYNQNDSQKTTAYNTNAESKLNAYNANADNRVAEFDAHTEQIQTDISELKSDIADLLYTNNLLTGKEYVWNKGFTSYPYDSEYYFYVKNIDVKKDVTYKANKQVRFVTYLDTLEYVDIESTKSFTPDRDCKVNITFVKKAVSADYLSYGKDYKLCESTIDFLDVIPKGEYWIPRNYVPKYFDEISNDFVKAELINLLDTSVSVEGTLLSNGSVIANSNYKTTDFIPINKDTYYTISPSIRYLLRYDGYKEIISGSYVDTEKLNYTFSQSVDGFVRFTYEVTNQNSQIIGLGDKPTKYVPYGVRKISEDISLSDKQTESVLSVGNVLYNKKWCACGDSFTSWTTETYEGSDYPNITNKDGNYKTYPFWIGSRNNMTVLNYAQSGETITTPTGTYSNIAFTNNIYKTIPLDVDYITLWFGINDASHLRGDSQEGESVDGTITLGTIDDTSVNTFYGAWNTVLEYLIEHHPYAHIGIIVSNGTDSNDVTNAIISVAQKWGIAYLDLNGDYTVPLMDRVSGKPNVCARAKELRKNAFRVPVGETGEWHPNVNAHKYQSTFIENWLRSI